MAEAKTHDEVFAEHVARMRKLRHRPGVRVVPKDDEMRRLLKHPTAGAFRPEGGLEWPDDDFTFRRLRDGDVLPESGAALPAHLTELLPMPAPAPKSSKSQS